MSLYSSLVFLSVFTTTMMNSVIAQIEIPFGGDFISGLKDAIPDILEEVSKTVIDFITGQMDEAIQFIIDTLTWVPTPTRDSVLSQPTDPIWKEIFSIYSTFTNISAALLILGFSIVLIANGVGLVPTPHRNKIAGRTVVASFFLFIPTLMAEILIIPLYVTSSIVDFFVNVEPAGDAFTSAVAVSLVPALTGVGTMVVAGIWLLILLFVFLLLALGVFRAIALVAVITLFPFFLTLWAIGIGPLKQVGNLGSKGMSWYIPLAIFPIPCAVMFGIGVEFISGQIFSFAPNGGGGGGDGLVESLVSLLLGLGFLTLGPIIGLQMTKVGKAASGAVGKVATAGALAAVAGPLAGASTVSSTARAAQYAQGPGGANGSGQTQAAAGSSGDQTAAEESPGWRDVFTAAKDRRFGEASKKAAGAALHGGPELGYFANKRDKAYKAAGDSVRGAVRNAPNAVYHGATRGVAMSLDGYEMVDNAVDRVKDINLADRFNTGGSGTEQTETTTGGSGTEQTETTGYNTQEGGSATEDDENTNGYWTDTRLYTNGHWTDTRLYTNGDGTTDRTRSYNTDNQPEEVAGGYDGARVNIEDIPQQGVDDELIGLPDSPNTNRAREKRREMAELGDEYDDPSDFDGVENTTVATKTKTGLTGMVESESGISISPRDESQNQDAAGVPDTFDNGDLSQVADESEIGELATGTYTPQQSIEDFNGSEFESKEPETRFDEFEPVEVDETPTPRVNPEREAVPEIDAESELKRIDKEVSQSMSPDVPGSTSADSVSFTEPTSFSDAPPVSETGETAGKNKVAPTAGGKGAASSTSDETDPSIGGGLAALDGVSLPGDGDSAGGSGESRTSTPSPQSGGSGDSTFSEARAASGDPEVDQTIDVGKVVFEEEETFTPQSAGQPDGNPEGYQIQLGNFVDPDTGDTMPQATFGTNSSDTPTLEDGETYEITGAEVDQYDASRAHAHKGTEGYYKQIVLDSSTEIEKAARDQSDQ